MTTNHGEDDSIRQNGSYSDLHNKYKKFDTEYRARVIFWIHLTSFLIAASVCVASFTVPILRKARPRGIAMWQWSLLIAVLLVGPLVSKVIVQVIEVSLRDREFSARENMIYYVIGLIESAWVGLWFTMVLIAWLIVVEEPSYLGVPYNEGEKIIRKFNTTYPIIKVTLITMIMGSFLWLLKDLGLMSAKSSFHIRRFFDRIREAFMYQCVIDNLLSNPDDDQSLREIEIRKEKSIENLPCFDQVSKKISSCRKMCPKEKPNQNKSKEEKFSFFRKIKIGNKKKNIVNISCLNDVTQETVSCWGMKQVIDGMMEKEYHYLTYNYEGSIQKIDNEEKAIYAADYIFKHLFGDQVQSDIGDAVLLSYFPDREIRQRAKECLHEGARAEKIDKKVFEKWMVKAYWERLSLVRALMANKSLFRALNLFINVLLVFLIFALWLIMVRVETRRVIFVVATAIAGSAFIFGETCKKILENLLFVFLVHPFDVGDCCHLDDTTVIIEGISVLSTTALTLENEIRHYSNAKLAEQTISNYTRSKHMGDLIEIPLDCTTPTRRIAKQLQKRVERYIEGKAKHWYSNIQWVMDFGDDASKMKMKLHFLHSINYHDYREIQARRSKLVSKIDKFLHELKSTTTQEEKSDLSHK